MQTNEPASVAVGDKIEWVKHLSDFLPADSWVLSYSLVNSDNKITFSATDNGDEKHLVSIPSATSASWAPGDYRWQSYVEKAGERFTVGYGAITLTPNFSSAAQDGRSHVKRVLDLLEAVIENRASSDQLAYSIAGRSVSKMAPEQLLTLYDRYRALYKQEQQEEKIASGHMPGGKIKVRFR